MVVSVENDAWPSWRESARSVTGPPIICSEARSALAVRSGLIAFHVTPRSLDRNTMFDPM